MNKLLNFKDFDKNMLTEEVEEIIPEGIPGNRDMSIGSEDPNSDARFQPYRPGGKAYSSVDDKIDEITYKLDEIDEDFLEDVINYLRDVLTEMEQQGFIEEDETDELDDAHDTIGKEWVIDVINLQEIPEDALIGVLDIIGGSQVQDREIDIEDDIEDDIEF